MFIGDILGNLPIGQTKHWLFAFGLGLVSRYSKWEVTLKTNPDQAALDSQEITLGVIGELSATFRFAKRFALRADARYLYEEQRYGGFGAGAEFQY
jgi:hypothetical protein